MRLRDLLAIGCGLLLAAPVLPAQSKKPEDLATGKLLVAPREAPDPAFAETVILLVRYEHGSGALGLMVNRPTKVPVSRALHDVKGAAKSEDTLWLGGPVDVAGVMALFHSGAPPPDALRIAGELFMVNSKKDLEAALSAAKKTSGNLRVFVGYCGWSTGQLENEVRLGGWHIFDRNEEAVFDSKPDTLWSRMIARTEFQVAMTGR
jgi:putative transcriptional regulator